MKPTATFLALTSLLAALPVLAAPQAVAPRSDAEGAVQSLVQPITQRLTVRNDAGRYDVWLVCDVDFDKLSDTMRKAVGARRDLGAGWRLQRWTWLEPDRSYVADVAGPTTFPLRLSRHLGGSLVELGDLGVQADAPAWAPPYRPLPVLLPHGSVR